MTNHKAMFWEFDDKVKCKLCPHYCTISHDKLGVCNTRLNINNELICINYGEVTSLALDPIEKKPLYHFKPGKNILSLGTFGCNMRCSFCQNYLISQQGAQSDFITSDEIINLIDKVKDNVGIAFTYNEPFMWYEYMYDTVKKIKQISKDISTVIVTNGYINKEPLEKILPYIDALNIDLKAYNRNYYQKICGGTLEPVLETIEFSAKNCHIEVTTLMVTGENDFLEEINQIAEFLCNIDKNIPLHLSRYFPNYKLKNQPTDIKKIIEAKDICKKYLNYVYIGNVSNIDSNTYCPKCNYLLIKRNDYRIECLINEKKCPNCGEYINIVL